MTHSRKMLRRRVVKLSAAPAEAAVYLYFPVSAESVLIRRSSLMSRETVACVVSVSYTHLHRVLRPEVGRAAGVDHAVQPALGHAVPRPVGDVVQIRHARAAARGQVGVGVIPVSYTQLT